MLLVIDDDKIFTLSSNSSTKFLSLFVADFLLHLFFLYIYFFNVHYGAVWNDRYDGDVNTMQQ